MPEAAGGMWLNCSPGLSTLAPDCSPNTLAGWALEALFLVLNLHLVAGAVLARVHLYLLLSHLCPARLPVGRIWATPTQC